MIECYEASAAALVQKILRGKVRRTELDDGFDGFDGFEPKRMVWLRTESVTVKRNSDFRRQEDPNDETMS